MAGGILWGTSHLLRSEAWLGKHMRSLHVTDVNQFNFRASSNLDHALARCQAELCMRNLTTALDWMRKPATGRGAKNVNK